VLRYGGTSAVVRERGGALFDGAEHGPVSAFLRAPDGAAGGSRPDGLEGATAVDLVPLQVVLHDVHCRGCARCADVCPFGALRMADVGRADPVAVLDAAACRGCSLCVAVCPTGAITPTVPASFGWDGLVAGGSGEAPEQVGALLLSCERRVGSLPLLPDDDTRVARFRCLGQVTAGMLLGLLARGVERIVVAACSTDRCRFGSGSELAADQVARARALLGLLGRAPDAVTFQVVGDAPLDPVVDLSASVGAGAGGGAP
jgi:heterodisulfide reductase subunit A